MRQKREWPFTVGTAGDRIPADTMQQVLNVLRDFPGKRMKISLALVRKRRSDPQNRFYWGVVVPLVTKMFVDYGNDVAADDVHRFLKGKIGGMVKPIVLRNGEQVSFVVDTSTKLTTYEWEMWMEKIRAWAASIDLFIPYPNEDCAHQWTTSTDPRTGRPVDICSECGTVGKVQNARKTEA